MSVGCTVGIPGQPNAGRADPHDGAISGNGVGPELRSEDLAIARRGWPPLLGSGR